MEKNVLKLRKLDISKMISARVRAVAAASSAPVKDLYSYLPNRIARELHPHVQFLTVAEVIEHSPDMKSFLLAPDVSRGTKSLAWFSAGQYLSVKLDVDGKQLCRPYSIASSPRETLAGRYRLTVKRVDGGIASGYILDHWAVGTKVVASAPLGDFTYEPLRDAKTVIGVAGGSGITPFRSLAYAISEGDEDCDLILLYGSRTKADAVFSDEIAAIAEKCPKVKIVNVLSDEKKKGCENGFITAKLIQKYAPKDAAYSIFLCGPQARAVRRIFPPGAGRRLHRRYQGFLQAHRTHGGQRIYRGLPRGYVPSARDGGGGDQRPVRLPLRPLRLVPFAADLGRCLRARRGGRQAACR